MKSKILALSALFLAHQAFAIVGIGFHYAPNFGTSLKASKETKVKDVTVEGLDVGDVNYSHGDFKDMQGFGFKLWVDILPFVDVEATYNIAWGSYNADLFVYNAAEELQKKQPVELKFDGVPFGKASPKFVSMNGDLSVTYPITFLPIIRPYIGGGLTYFINTPVMNHAFVKEFMDKGGDALLSTGGMTDEEAKKLANELGKQLGGDSFEKSFAGHALLGVRAKLPVIPIAVYVNGKYYFGGDFPDEVDRQNFVLECGAGFAL
ncbi:MAG: hypothetical protein LBR60_08695 [Fibrobacter sp.]|jgi:hypothetical protein|nr:hypothetical protein [Fibrobacter sp.]